MTATIQRQSTGFSTAAVQKFSPRVDRTIPRVATENPCPRTSRRLLRQLVVEVQHHHDEARQDNNPRQPAKRLRPLPLARLHGLAIGVNLAEDKSCGKACDVRGVV